MPAVDYYNQISSAPFKWVCALSLKLIIVTERRMVKFERQYRLPAALAADKQSVHKSPIASKRDISALPADVSAVLCCIFNGILKR